MKNTKRRNIAVAVLGLAVAAFAADRIWSGSETDSPGTVAQAKGAPLAQQPSSATLTLAKARPMPCRPESLLACRLEELTGARGGEVRDLFQPSVQWIAPKAASVKGEPDIVESDPVQVFQHRHKLSAVLVNSAGGAAVISNTLMRVGQSLDGFHLQEIRRNAVVFTAPDGRSVVLALDGANSDS